VTTALQFRDANNVIGRCTGCQGCHG
jgi:hypothetical protein